MASPTLTHSQKAIIKSTAPVLRSLATDITTHFYQTLLAENPSLKDTFNLTNQQNGRQPRALAGAVITYASHIDDLSNPDLTSAIERIAHKHVSLMISADQYAVVGRYLIASIQHVLGEAATPEITEAWTSAFQLLAGVFIGKEKGMYHANTVGNFAGWRKFRVVQKVAESQSIISFYLAPVDGVVPLPRYMPGQYVSVRVFVPHLRHFQARQYSLSQAPGRDGGSCYRISVRRAEWNGECEKGSAAPALVSNVLHDAFHIGDELEVSHPQGDNFLDPTDQSQDGVPVVLISAGVGVTPVLAMLGSLAPEEDVADGDGPAWRKSSVKRPVSWIHAAQSSKTLAFYPEVLQMSKASTNVSARLFVRDGDVVDGGDYRVTPGRLDLNRLDKERDLWLGDRRAKYYICGPVSFMRVVKKGLMDMGVEEERVHPELFDTGSLED